MATTAQGTVSPSITSSGKQRWPYCDKVLSSFLRFLGWSGAHSGEQPYLQKKGKDCCCKKQMRARATGMFVAFRCLQNAIWLRMDNLGLRVEKLRRKIRHVKCPATARRKYGRGEKIGKEIAPSISSGNKPLSQPLKAKNQTPRKISSNKPKNMRLDSVATFRDVVTSQRKNLYCRDDVGLKGRKAFETVGMNSRCVFVPLTPGRAEIPSK